MPQFRILYMKPDHFRDLSFGTMRGDKLPTIADLLNTHAELRTMEAENLEDVFRIQQAENWATDWQACNALLDTKGLRHTSMSVGDVAQEIATGDYYIVASVGFTKLAKGE